MEQELKIRLSSLEDYRKVEKELGPPLGEAEQVNHYLDTPALELRGREIMARIREQKGRLRLTVKWGARRAEGFFEAQEEEADLRASTVEQALGSGEARDALERLCPPAQDLDLAGLLCIGTLRNLRKTYALAGGLELELDRSRFGDGAEDWEIEVETPDREAASALLESLLRRSGAQGAPQLLTKYERFLQHHRQRRSL